MKFGRNYRMTIEASKNSDGTTGERILIGLPFTVEFSIIRTYLTSANVCTFRIYNLSKETRLKLRKDESDMDVKRVITFAAGYGDKLSDCLVGNITRAYSVREGVDFVTTIEAFDGGFLYYKSEEEYAYNRGKTKRSAVLDIIKKLNKYGIKEGSIGKIEGKFKRKFSDNGHAVKVLKNITEKEVFIDNQIINILSNNEVRKGDTVIIDSDSGLLGTPVLDLFDLSFEMLFEPKLDIGTKIRLKSITEEGYNADYKIRSITHNGIISETHAGKAVTKVGVGYGDLALVEVG